MPTITDENTVSVEQLIEAVKEEQPSLSFPEDSEGYELLVVLKRRLDKIDMDIDDIYEQRFVDTAVGKNLERIGAKYGLQRKTNESDEKLRLRIKAARRVALSRGTYQDIAEIALDVLDAHPSQLDLVRPSESNEMGTGIIRVSSAVLDETPFTTTEIANILSDGAIGGHRIIVEQSDAFRFGDADNGFGTEWGQTIE